MIPLSNTYSPTILTQNSKQCRNSYDPTYIHHLRRSFPPLSPPPLPSPLIRLTRPSHIRINGQTKRRKPRAPQRRSLRSRRRRQHTTCNTARQNPILQIILRPKPFNTTFSARKYRSDFPEVLGGGVGAGAQVLEALF